MQMVCEVENGTAAATKGGLGEAPGRGRGTAGVTVCWWGQG